MSIKIYLKSTDEIAKLREVNLHRRRRARRPRGGVPSPACRPGSSTRSPTSKLKAAQGASRPSSATTATRPCSARRSTRSSSTASRARTWSSRTATSSAIDFGCFKDGLCGDSARTIPIGKVTDEADEADGRRPGSRSSAPSRSACRAIACGTSAGPSSRTSSRSATRWCASSWGTASAAQMHEEPHGPELRRGRARGYG